MENDNELKHKPSGEIDRFSRFMFGNHHQRGTYKWNESATQQIPEHSEQASFNRKDDWLIGFREKRPPTFPHTNQNQIESLLNQIDLMQLMETADLFVATSKQFEPLFKEISPYFHRLVKKFKAFKDG